MTNPVASDLPLVSLVMPVRNEVAHLPRALDAINAQTYPRQLIEVIVVDGGSTDGTVELVQRHMAADERVALIGGDGVTTPAAMNRGMAEAGGDVVVKVDGHGWMNAEFVEEAVRSLRGDARLGCVGGLIQPVAESTTERAIALARFSRFGVGGGVYTLPDRPQEVDTVQCGAYRRSVLRAVGGFDPAMVYGEDEELNYRVRLAGWRIFLNPAMRFAYHVRPSVGSLFRQYFRYGRARVSVIRKHRAFLSVKHVAPSAAVVLLAASAPFVLLEGWRLVSAIAWGGYAAFLMVGAFSLSIRHRFARLDLIAASLLALHAGYGIGFVLGLAHQRPVAPSKRVP